MPKTLVIVESPTKAKTISKFLGSSYIVTSSFGHVRDLPKSTMGIDTEHGTFTPQYRVSPDKTQQVKKLKELAKKCENNIIFATDEDREGEAISWHLAQILGIDPDRAQRIAFHEITKHAVEEALQHPRHIDQKLVDAQQARRVLDRLVGYELSPFLWKKVSPGLSAGRVQSVAVRLVVEREKERDAFNSQEYWSLKGVFSKKDNTDHTFEAKLNTVDGKKLKKLAIENKEQVDTFLSDLKDKKYTVSSIEKKEAKRTPPPPYRTSTLQQQANQKLGYSSKQSMRLAQQLYEGVDIGSEHVGLITYMRTDSNNLSTKFLSETQHFIRNTYGENFCAPKTRVYAKKTKGAQEAHEAIRPTDPNKTPEAISGYLTPQQLKLYSLIWKRAVATQMSDAKLDKTTIDIESTETQKVYGFRATGQIITSPGWLSLYPQTVKEDTLPETAVKDNMACSELTPEQHFTQPPARYSDATLIKTLEELGIGRPSTYAPTIATIEARKYVDRDENKKFLPLDVAHIVNEVLVEHFTAIVDYSFTAQMEEDLDAIAEGKKEWKPIVKAFYIPFHETIVEKTEHVSREDISHAKELGIDPETKKPVSAKIGRYGPFVQLGTKDDEEKPRFASLREGQMIQTITLDEALTLLSLPRTLGKDNEEQDIKANVGRFGPYVQVGKEYFSIKKAEKDPYTITLEEAKEIITLGREEKAKKIIRTFVEEGIQILRGPYGPYITDGTKNARIPKDEEHPENYTLEQCIEMLKNAKPGRKGRKKTAAKKKKPAPKKPKK
ncbi:MAG: type I DNA topoisomerase [Candidatus Magasanikbacteria bacterium]|jgi:DNA topoisomerase I|nr:type I DNA topoisomerase [Candidatus Magasanikbacteria bacterium]MBT5262712.1 type I DNA topoisomerase [Candidatus Magasanikbacteria bacterium]MBT5820326.1 type I DNA topoisomerase [Candidatus Magasanikbacteria bacterium]MBT6294828.1 type I DNA topoisomerase [Candidatus Magasanikbacteria bacterium]